MSKPAQVDIDKVIRDTVAKLGGEVAVLRLELAVQRAINEALTAPPEDTTEGGD